MNRNVLNSPRLLELKRHRQKAVWGKIFIFLLGLLAILALLAYLSHLDSLNISEVQIVGNKVVDAGTIKEVVEQQIAGEYLWFFSRTNILYYPGDNIKNELWNKFKRLKDISLSIKNNKILEVFLTERVAKFMWCGAVLLQTETENPKCYFLDEDGYIFDEAPYFSGEVYFKFYGSADINIDNPLGHSLTGEPFGSYFFKQNFKRLVSFKDILIGIGLKPVATYITDDGNIEIFLSKGVFSATEPKIILKTDSDFQNVAENLEAALTTEPLQSQFKNKYSSLQYIDLRFGNKVYDKFSP
ncbi:MAG: hypothetical protein UU82_C0027G0006 [Candidatus Nomurabacteria bacterium GW2011_GWC2_41_8]|uniref:POTRA domain-containing protein n=3 Tax=Candidatus Nomuraibacteriota TaxID=1752729 RepID=A0A1F6YC38_9BACT|nr:MAG: hypothetical protein UU58_C0014G0006 [Candidatus Nomurabacteria bacterium GW2011_GWA2_41_25]KKS23527.1 MAG: hypothetical protein UU82_C0027G0006 [Candidatus Nomurabacteria bacterium GW2011_GWC2_41_8]OGI67566.1 MAG: hypothetical protein A2823_02970 [Candidatus Nomurabacteria bacterium RIFCSPHIGHO2_01_FULL_41_91]OGI80196.1 MAG: hypothetical protein A3D43_03205 [Candidatus Nomurabacteria bacterium RIFCSPHIGHO2_02_FULL_41_52]OGI85260.1 MAG: hypothetical protein A3F49_01065 [Candidatus Nomur